MNKHARDLFGSANLGTDSLVGISDSLVGRSLRIRNLFKQVWPKKTAQHLALAADITVRQAERILAGHQGLGAEATWALLEGEHGGALLEAGMMKTPNWYRDVFHERRIAAARKARKEAERTLRELEDDA